MKKIFFFDVDGTIVDSGRQMHYVSDKTKYAIKELSKDNYVFISSGRCKCMLDKQILDLNANGFVLCNGAYAEINGKEIFSKSFSKDDISRIKKTALDNNGFYCLEANDKVYVDSLKNRILNSFISRWEIDLSFMAEDDHKERDYFIAMIGFENQDGLSESYMALRDYAGLDRHHWFTSYDVNIKGINKGYGCKKVMEYLNIPVENSYAFGDGLNDLQMLEAVGHPVVMANCMKELKNRGFEDTDDVLDDGVYEYLVKNHLIKAIE
ncbi:MAG: HAD family hydrolase [Erysipelotrichaceae bacterium]|nr:HAD family hydrolase [Erysipelotrichaceae bacterium]